MDPNDLFDVPKVRLKGAGPKPAAKDPGSQEIADLLSDDPGDCPYGSPDEPQPQDDADLDVDIAARAKGAAAAHDAYAAAKAAYDLERSSLQEELDGKLAKLKEAMATAREARTEAVLALGAAMKKDKITTIPMTDRPDIRTKVTKGKKQGITKKWLVDPEHVAVKAFDAVLSGVEALEEEDGSVFTVPQSGKDFATRLWNEQPKSEGTETVIVPDPYEDEPDPN